MKIKSGLLAALLVGLSTIVSAPCMAQSSGADDSLVTDGTFKGTLHTGKVDSYMVYVGEESGDFAAFCFANNSEVGRAILAACKDGGTCEFTGKVDQGVECKVDKDTQKILSASGKVLKVESVKSLGRKPSGSQASEQGQPYTPAPQTAERKAIADALRVPVEKELKKSVVFKIDHLKVQDGWAFLRGVPQRPDGKPMDYSNTSYRRQKELGMFDDQFSALLQKKGEKWIVVTYNIGATDVVYLDWAEKYKAPPAIFE